ncbi:MAG: hypothetical protein Kow0090_00110 [Myxococcota bacterium]
MRVVFSCFFGGVVLVSFFGCGNVKEDFCKKADECDMLSAATETKSVSECVDKLEETYEEIERDCPDNPGAVKDSHEAFIDCAASLDCSEWMKDESDACESEAEKLLGDYDAYCEE